MLLPFYNLKNELFKQFVKKYKENLKDRNASLEKKNLSLCSPLSSDVKNYPYGQQNIDLDGKTLPSLTYNSFLAGMGRNQGYSSSCSAQTTHKSVSNSSAKQTSGSMSLLS